MAVCVLVLFWAVGRNAHRGRDTVLLNDIVQTVKDHMDHLEALDSTGFGTELLVFDSSGRLCYASDGAPADIRTASDAVHRGLLCMAVTEQERFLGTVAVPDPMLAEYDRMRQRLLLAAILTAAAVLVVLVLIGLYVRRRIVTPFRRMQQFAEQIAQGNLEDPLLMEEDNPFGSFTESFDIMREELRDARAREDAMKLREKELAASLSHDIKTPVTGIRLICEVLEVRTEDPYLRGKIGNIHQKAEQIRVLADDLLTAALDELGEMRVQCQDVPSSVLHELTAEHDTRGLLREDPVPECLLHADTSRLSQVIANIISNSYKYADTPIEVRYAFRGSTLAMALSDHGGGIPEEELPLVTTKYYRGQTTSDGKEGSGLGLYISDVLMKRMGGQLLCENRDGGLTVTLLIPLS